MTPLPQISTGSAPGKVILVGEHAVVYGQPAIAVPLNNLHATATITSAGHYLEKLVVDAPGIALHTSFNKLAEDHPLAAAILETMRTLNISEAPGGTLRVHSALPVAAGLGSSAAITIAIARALAACFATELPATAAAQIASAVEHLHHGSSSGIDPTVIAHHAAICFTKNKDPEFIYPHSSLELVIADSGLTGSTREAVNAVRKLHSDSPDRFSSIFAEIGALAFSARAPLEAGKHEMLGALMNANHRLLQAIGVSTALLDALCAAAIQAGAYGAKLTGAGTGGCMIALVDKSGAPEVQKALLAAGAKSASITTLESTTR